MKETVTEESKEMVATGPDGEQIKFMARVIKTDHHETDAEGNPKISVEIKVPSISIGLTPGEVK